MGPAAKKAAAIWATGIPVRSPSPVSPLWIGLGWIGLDWIGMYKCKPLTVLQSFTPL